jgi:DNA-binding NarL/FixJ family response regulator
MNAPVLVVDDHQLISGALAMALRGRGIDAAAVSPDALTARIDAPAPDGGLVLLDLGLGPGLDGADLVPRLCAAGWRVLVVTASTDEATVAVAVRAGALGWVSKTAPFDQLVATAARAAAGRPLMSAAERARLELLAESSTAAARREEDLWAKLTPRERQIVDRIIEGRRPTSIAEEFVVSVATVRTQIRSILTKLGVSSQLEVAALARERDRRG